MNDRPKRERKPTQPFQYHNVSAESNIADVSSTLTTKSPNKDRTRGAPNGDVSRCRGGGRGRGRGRGAGRGRGRGLNKINTTSNRGRQSPTLNSDELVDDEFLLSDPVEDAGALANDPDGLDYEKEDGAITSDVINALQYNPTIRRRKIPIQGPLLSRRRGEEDDVIEQWYADPYERINPNDIAYDQWRLKNLIILLENRGYSNLNARQMAAWLMKCNGFYKEYTAPVRKSRAKKPTKFINAISNVNKHRSVTPSADSQQGQADEEADEDDNIASTQGENSSQQEPDTAFAAFQAAMLPHTNGSESAIHQSERENHDYMPGTKADQSSQTSFGMSGLTLGSFTNGKLRRREESEDQDDYEDSSAVLQAKSQELNDLLKLENLKRCLNVFHAVYGPDGPKEHLGQFEHNHFSQSSTLPALLPKAGLRTQAHYALQTVPLPIDNPAFFNGAQSGGPPKGEEAISHQGEGVKFRNVFTEDPDFGLTMIPPSKRATEADMKLYYAQFERAKVGRPATINYIEPEAEDESHVVEGAIKPILDPMLVKLQNQESAKVICEELEQKIFDWETPSTMLGGIVKQSKIDPMRDGQFALKEHHIWKDLRRRQQILDEGGEDAAKLLEEEYEEAQLELRRERRRRENAKVKEKKMAAREAEIARWGGDMGMRKRVKFSEEITEEW